MQFDMDRSAHEEVMASDRAVKLPQTSPTILERGTVKTYRDVNGTRIQSDDSEIDIGVVPRVRLQIVSTSSWQ